MVPKTRLPRESFWAHRTNKRFCTLMYSFSPPLRRLIGFIVHHHSFSDGIVILRVRLHMTRKMASLSEGVSTNQANVRFFASMYSGVNFKKVSC
mmetsp:Transcript_16239/g.40003  ORF Transcript_16239/g.40003 Transcript_16239/m.40003 type:complete len:94 (-) Transcript_16239:944-1225(-)